MTRVSNRDDVTEDLFLAVRELIEHFEVAPREVRRLVNQAIAGTPPASIRDRVEPGGSPDLDPVGPTSERPENGPGAPDGAEVGVGSLETIEPPVATTGTGP